MGISSTGYQRPRSAKYIGSANTTATSYATLLNITGAGQLIHLNLSVSTGASISLKVTIDGNAITTITFIPSSTATPYYVTPLYNNMGNNSKPTTSYADYGVSFKKSLKIEASVTGSNTITAFWTYDLQ